LAKTVAIGPIREANSLAALFRELGWTVITNASGKETRKLAMRAKAQVVVLPCNSSPESGWLSAAKLSKCEPKIRVVLIGLDSGPAEEEFALFAGASAYLAESDVAYSVRLKTTRPGDTIMSPGRFFYSTSKIASISTAIPPGRLLCPTALRAPTPASSPKTSFISSE
jgi:DNA-binding NarL/FixJ family response regulator